MTRMDADTAGRVNAVVRDVMSAFRNTVELVYHAPELFEAAGFESFEAWAMAQPKPQIPTRAERRELAFEMKAIGMTQRETAAVLGVHEATVSRDVRLADASDEPDAPEHAEPDRLADASDEPAVAPPDTEDEEEYDLIRPAPGYVKESTAMYVADLKRYVAGVVNVVPPPKADPATCRRIRRGVVRALNEAIDRLARDERAERNPE